MIKRLASSFLTLLLASNAALADFAKPPAGDPRNDTRVASRDDDVVVRERRRPAPVAMPVRMPDRAQVAQALAARRDKNIASFRAYMRAGVYPHNTVRPGPLNVWRDADGHLCAAATMIDRDGQHELVTGTAETNDFIRLLDVTNGPLLDWIVTSGLTIEEIDRIQEPLIMPDPSEQDPQWRAAEDAKLRRGYVATSAWLDKHRAAGLAAAVDRLMAYPVLANRLVDGRI